MEAIVRNAAVDDTHHVDRAAFTVERPLRPWYRYPNRALMAVTAVGLWICDLAVLPPLAARAMERNADAIDRFLAAPFHRAGAAYVLVLIPVAGITVIPRLSPASLVPVAPFGRVDTPAAMWRQMECVTQDEQSPNLGDTYEHGEAVMLIGLRSCPPSAELAAWVEAHVPADAVFAMNRWNRFWRRICCLVALSGFDFSLPMEALLTQAMHEPISQSAARTWRAAVLQRSRP